MAYHFRKLRQSIRLIPTSKSVGFSTRLSEGDQTKTPYTDGTLGAGNATAAEYIDAEALNQGTEGPRSDDGTSPSTHTLARSQSEPDLFSRLLPTIPSTTTTLPISYLELVQILLPSAAKEDTKTTSISDIDSISGLVKSVGFTSDDILVQPLSPCGSSNSNIIGRTRERIPVSVLSGLHHFSMANTTAVKPLDYSLNLDSVVINNQRIQTFSGASDDLSQLSTNLYCTAGTGGGGQGATGNEKPRGGPSDEQMGRAKGKAEHLVANLFKGRHDYSALHKNVVMENNLFGDNKRCVGVTAYALELLKLRLRIHIKFSSTSMEIMSITTTEQNGVIRVHWRLKGLPQTQILKFWRLFQSKESVSKEDWEWIEAFSYFHVGNDGQIHKHRIDRMLPDGGIDADKLTEKLRDLLNPAKPLVS